MAGSDANPAAELKLMLGADTRRELDVLRKEFPDLRLIFESGFGFLEAVASLIIPSAALAVSVLDFVYRQREKDESTLKVLYVHIEKGGEKVHVDAADFSKSELIELLRKVDG